MSKLQENLSNGGKKSGTTSEDFARLKEMDVEDLKSFLKTSSHGLTKAEAENRLLQYGQTRYPRRKKTLS
jgi:hypothetical protein